MSSGGYLVLILCVLFSTGFAKSSVCLVMIVKDESGVIVRALQSVVSLISSWVIVDTGSTDGTQEVIRRFFSATRVPGVLHERPWRNFAVNRNEALSLAAGKADYFMTFDADEFLLGNSIPELTRDYYIMYAVQADGSLNMRIVLYSARLPWQWVGVIHEYLDLPDWRGLSYAVLDSRLASTYGSSPRALSPAKYSDDAKILEAALLENPGNSRYTYFLAHSYRLSSQFSSALTMFMRRVELLLDSSPETFDSLLQIARLQEKLGFGVLEVTRSYLTAFENRPIRLEPLFFLAEYYRHTGNFSGCFRASLLRAPPPHLELSYEPWIYTWGLLSCNTICAHMVGEYRTSFSQSSALLLVEDVSAELKAIFRQIQHEASDFLSKPSSARAAFPPEKVLNCLAYLQIAVLEREFGLTQSVVESSIARMMDGPCSIDFT